MTSPQTEQIDYRVGNEKLVRITKDASVKINELKVREANGEFLRIRITGGGCNGLSYHQFSLACLARAYDISNKKWLKKYFYKASQFTQAMQLSNGEIGYTGRGANSIYHLCSGIYGMALDFKTSSDPKSLENCLRSVSYLEGI